jgi:hypothetical protein
MRPPLSLNDDPETLGYAAVIEWLNLQVVQIEHYAGRPTDYLHSSVQTPAPALMQAFAERGRVGAHDRKGEVVSDRLGHEFGDGRNQRGRGGGGPTGGVTTATVSADHADGAEQPGVLHSRAHRCTPRSNHRCPLPL